MELGARSTHSLGTLLGDLKEHAVGLGAQPFDAEDFKIADLEAAVELVELSINGSAPFPRKALQLVRNPQKAGDAIGVMVLLIGVTVVDRQA